MATAQRAGILVEDTSQSGGKSNSASCGYGGLGELWRGHIESKARKLLLSVNLERLDVALVGCIECRS